MCNDMKRFEKMAEEKRKEKGKQEIDFIVKEPERIVVNPETEGKHRQTKTSLWQPLYSASLWQRP